MGDDFFDVNIFIYILSCYIFCNILFLKVDYYKVFRSCYKVLYMQITPSDLS
jgi:hypothetical protein